MLCYVMLFMLCYAMLCYVMLCYVMLCYVMLCYVMCYVTCYCFDFGTHLLIGVTGQNHPHYSPTAEVTVFPSI